ncbi:MAG: beta-ketoacyl-ACP synthase II [Oligoflexus sp.]
MRRVVITGMGTVAPTGQNVNDAWTAAVNCRSGISRITGYDPSEHRVQIAGEIKDWNPVEYIDPKDLRKVPRFIQYATVAAIQAVQDAGLETDKNPDRYGCAIGVGMGGLSMIEESTRTLDSKGEKRLSPFFIPYAIPNMAAGVVSIRLQLKGPNVCTTTACASGTHAIGEAMRYIREGAADAMVCGGAESVISALGIGSFAALKALSTRNEEPEKASRPFDLDRDGFVMGEGAGVLVVEDLEHARRRGARIYAELVGYGLSGDAHHITAPPPRGEGGQRAMRAALVDAKLKPEEVDYINAHGTSTKMNDQYESEAIQEVFGTHANSLHISSTKGVTGHCIGAAGGIEAIYSTLAIYHNVIPPTANLDTPDPLCTLNYTPNQAVEKRVDVAISNSFGFGGTNATIAIKSFS